jgi:hypothetical protein
MVDGLALKILGEKAKCFVAPAANIALSMPIAVKGIPILCSCLQHILETLNGNKFFVNCVRVIEK